MSHQSSSSADYSGHPLVGSWFVDTRPDDPDQPPELVRLSVDGGVVVTAVGGITGVGIWSPNGDRSGNVTFSIWLPNGNRLLVRANAHVTPDGESFSGPYTNELFPPTGESTGEIGPGTAMATRMTVEAPGSPVAPIGEGSGMPQTPPGEPPAS